MYSTKIIELEERCIRTERATKTDGPMVAKAFAARFKKCLTEEEKARYPDAAGYLALVLDVIGVRMVREVREDMVDSDKEDRRARMAYRKECDQRDAAAGELYDCVVEFRRRCRTHLTPKEERIYLLGLSGDTPRQPFELSRWADGLEETIDSGPLSVGAKKFDPSLYRSDLRDCHEKVDTALDSVAAAHREKQETGHVRQLAVERCERVQLRCSQVVEAMLAFVKRADLARDLRGVGRPGRPPQDRRTTLRGRPGRR